MINSFIHKIQLDDRGARKQMQPCCINLLVRLQTRRSEQMGWQRTHTHTELSGRAINIYFVHHAEVIRCEHKMVYYFHVRRIQNFLQMIMAQGFPAWAEEGISRATGVVRLISILVQNDCEGKKKQKTSVSSRRPAVPRIAVP